MSSHHYFKLEKDLCRCCHAEGSFVHLSEPVYNLGQREVYSEMLKESLDIDVSQMPGELSLMTFKICGACVLRLRDAHNFKQQVTLCEQRFKEMYKNMVIEKVKKELDATDDDDGFDIKFDDSDDDQPVIRIKVEESKKAKAKSKVKPRLRKKKAQAKKTRTSNNLSAEESQAEGPGEDLEKKGSRALQKCAIQETDYRIEGDNYICSHCQKVYHKKFSLMFHIKTKHYKIPRYHCPYCKLAFMTPAPLTVHKLQEHNVDDRVQCKACNAAFNTKVQLRKHINNFHMLGEKYKCEFCEYESFSFEGMYKHKFKHRTEKNFHCRFCRKSFLRKATLDLHERIHTGDRRKVCTVCGQAFVQKASLNYHMTKYHPEVNF
ncbi:hypothetical protein O0L34_g2788 [Tuta absoluta]|nr:hypothetical protein O0L34_g2788 [Tuta absoluta]